MPPQRSPRGDPGWDTPRAVTAEDLDDLRESIASLNERLDLMNETMPAAMAVALTQAIQATLQDPRFWDAALDQFGEAVGRRSVKAAGGWTLGLFKNVPSTVFKWLIIAALVYQLGGWAMLTGFFKSWLAIKQ